MSDLIAMESPEDTTVIVALRAALGGRAVLAPDEASAFGSGWSRLGAPVALVRPGSVDEVVAAVRICAEAGVPLVPWGGRTGLVSGGCADDAVAVSLDRLNVIEEIDAVDGVMTVQAGCVLETVCDAAAAEGMFFPLDLGARGSATIGGVVSTNAGGNRVVRFGMTRDLVLGLEAVLADGTLVSSMMPLVKNNTGYDLKQIFVGAEGTLGIVTRAVLRIRAGLPSRNAALVAVESFGAAARLLRALEAGLGGQLSAFEAMWPRYYDLVTTAPAKGRPILAAGHPLYVLVEAMGGDITADADRFQSALGQAMEEGLVVDAVVARSESDVAAMWALRDDGEQVSRIGPYVALDVSLRLSRIEPFVDRLDAILQEQWPGTKVVLFGHVGDGNLHVIVSLAQDDAATRRAVTHVVLELAGSLGGSISAEHGIGLDKRDYLPLSRSAAELSTMRLLKSAFDPHNLMNPGKILPVLRTGLD